MKILYTNFHTHHKGGHATYVLNLYEALHSRHEIYIADPETSGLHEAAKKLAPEHVFAQTFPKRLNEIPDIIRQALKIRRLIRDKKIDVVHVNGSPDLQLVLIALIGVRQPPALVYTKHNSIPINKNIFSRFKFKCAHQIIMVCGCQQADFEDIGIPKNRLTVIKNGLDVHYFAPSAPSLRQEMRQKLNLADDELVLVSSAGPSLYKRWDCMVEAVSRLPNKKIKIVIIGGLPPQDYKTRFVDPFGMKDRVIFTGMQEDTRPYVAVGDLGFVLSDSIETVSFACREMMSQGLPVIVSDYQCLPENVRPGKNGWVVKVGDVAAIQHIVEEILQNPSMLKPMGEAAREQALEEFGIEQFAAATERVYQKILVERK